MSSTSVNPYNDSIPSIFGVSQNELATLANYNVPDVTGLPATLPGMSLIVIQGDATFTTARPLVGSGILVVLGNLTIPAGSSFSGVIYVTGTYSQLGPSLVSGAVVGDSTITMTGGSDITEVDWDATIVQHRWIMRLRDKGAPPPWVSRHAPRAQPGSRAMLPGPAGSSRNDAGVR